MSFEESKQALFGKQGEWIVYRDEPQAMGIGKLGDQNTVFCRDFRWTLGSQNLPTDFVRSCKVDYFRKEIRIEYYDLINDKQSDHVFNFLNNIKDEKLVFKQFDGCGNLLKEKQFSDLKITSLESSDYDYASSDVSTHKIIVKYSILNQSNNSTIDNIEEKEYWTLDVGRNGNSKEIKVVVEGDGPYINVEETEINYLNAKFLIPGIAKARPVYLKIGSKEFIDPENFDWIWQDKFNVKLSYYYKGEKRETFSLGGCFVGNIQSPQKPTEPVNLTIMFDNVQYKSLLTEKKQPTI